MSQQIFNSNGSLRILEISQLEALKSISQLLLREISELESKQAAQKQSGDEKKPIDLVQELRQFEIRMIRCALIRSMGRQNKAAHLLGMKITTLCEKIKRYRITLDDIHLT